MHYQQATNPNHGLGQAQSMEPGHGCGRNKSFALEYGIKELPSGALLGSGSTIPQI